MFTVDESELLFEAYDAVMDLSDDQAIDAWIAWSVEAGLSLNFSMRR